jgi:hypothetical protein
MFYNAIWNFKKNITIITSTSAPFIETRFEGFLIFHTDGNKIIKHGLYDYGNKYKTGSKEYFFNSSK